MTPFATAARRSPGRWRYRPGREPGVRERARGGARRDGAAGRRAGRAARASAVRRAGGEDLRMRLRALAPAKVNLIAVPRADARGRAARAGDGVSVAVAGRRARARGARRVAMTIWSICPGVEGENLAARALAALRARGWDGPPVTRLDREADPGRGRDGRWICRRGGGAAPGDGGRARDGPRRWTRSPPSWGPTCRASCSRAVDRARARGRSSSTSSRWSSTLTWSCRRSSRWRPPTCTARPIGSGCRAPLAELEHHYLDLSAALALGGRLPDELIVNDLERAAVSLCPSIADVLEAVLAAGAEHAIVSGSGPTVVGIWWGSEAHGCGPPRLRTALV